MTEAPPLSPDALLASLREMPSPGGTDAAMKERIHARLTVSLVGLAPAIAAVSPPPLGGNSASIVSGMAPATSGGLIGGVKGVVLAWLTPVFVAGTLSGVAADRWYSSHRDSAAAASPLGAKPHAAQWEPALTAPVQAVPTANVEELERVQEVVATAPLVNAPLASAEASSNMAEERQMLDAARTALARGEPQAGVLSLEKHAKRFPKGTLVEEREALYVRILVAMGNDDAASNRATTFRRRFPNSIFLPVVERAVASISRRNGQGESKPQNDSDAQ